MRCSSAVSLVMQCSEYTIALRSAPSRANIAIAARTTHNCELANRPKRAWLRTALDGEDRFGMEPLHPVEDGNGPPTSDLVLRWQARPFVGDAQESSNASVLCMPRRDRARRPVPRNPSKRKSTPFNAVAWHGDVSKLGTPSSAANPCFAKAPTLYKLTMSPPFIFPGSRHA